MSIATEITRLQGIKTNIRTALVTQGIAQASSHNMADFSADILAIQGGSEGVYITVTCNSAYQGYDIILSANESELDRKQCPSSKDVNFFVSADDVTLPAIFTISNSLNDITISVTANIYGWYDLHAISPLVPALTGKTDKEFSSSTQSIDTETWMSFTGNWDQQNQGWSSSQFTNAYIGYAFDEPVSVTRVDFKQIVFNDNYGVRTYRIEYSDDGSTYYPATGTLTALMNLDRQTISLDDKGSHKYWRMFIFNSTSSTVIFIALRNLQFYG